MKIWLAILVGSAASMALLWFMSIPLGIRGEWTWNRVDTEPDTTWNLIGATVASLLFAVMVLLGYRRFEQSSFATTTPVGRIEIGLWLTLLVVVSFAWIWVVQEISPIKNRLGKAAFVLYYPSSSGYFTRSRYEQPGATDLLSGYEKLMREGDVLHTGTHPPGLFLIFHALITACQSSDVLSAALDATRPPSFQEACDVIATNAARSSILRPFTALDRRVLWLATMLVMLAASLSVVPLYALIRRTSSIPNAWYCASLWTAMPAVAIFTPKSDAAFPLIAVTLLLIWLSAWERRSIVLGLITGFFTWCGLICSLAFLPVVLAAGILTLGWAVIQRQFPSPIDPESVVPQQSHAAIDERRLLCIVAATIGFAIPTIILWFVSHVNLLNIWLLNYQNHAGFYGKYPRTYWQWLLINPIELCCAAGWPLALLALASCVQSFVRLLRNPSLAVTQNSVHIAVTITFVWGLLWLTGKNSGEAARLWILLLPWLVWLASFQIESVLSTSSSQMVRHIQVVAFTIISLTVCFLTVARVNGFHFEGG